MLTPRVMNKTFYFLYYRGIFLEAGDRVLGSLKSYDTISPPKKMFGGFYIEKNIY